MERFESNFVSLAGEIRATVPELITPLADTLLAGTPSAHLDFFIRTWFPHALALSTANLDHFREAKADLLPGSDFYPVMAKLATKNQNVVWDYIHTLFILSFSCDGVRDLVGTSVGADPDLQKMVKTTHSDFSAFVANIVSWKRAASTKPAADAKPAEGEGAADAKFLSDDSSIAKLAKEISAEISVDELKSIEEGMSSDPMSLLRDIMSGDESKGVGKLMRAVTNKLKEKIDSGAVNQTELMREANVLMEKLASGGLPGGTAPGMSGFADIMKGMMSGGGFADIMKGMMSGGGFGDMFGKKKKKKKQTGMGVPHGDDVQLPHGRRVDRKFKKHLKKKLAEAAAAKEKEAK